MSQISTVEDGLMEIWRASAVQRVPLPPEIELASRLGVSRPMVREALVRLEADGLVARRAHQGTFPNVSALRVPFRIDQSYELTTGLTDAGFDVSVDITSVGWSQLEEHEAEDLDAVAGASCFRVAKRWLADGVPVVRTVDVVPALERNDVRLEEPYSVFAVVDALRGATVEWESAALKPVLPTAEERTSLALDEGEPVLQITLVGVSLHGEPLYRAHELHATRDLEYGMIRRSARA